MENKKLVLTKNIACLSFGLMLIFLAGIFVASSYYENLIHNLINQSSMLKDYDFHYWGQQPNQQNSNLYMKITPYSLSYQNGKTTAQLAQNLTVQLDYTFQYTNTSLAQGNSGKLSYLNNWQLKPKKSQKQFQNEPRIINSINPAAQKIFYYDYYATKTRQMTLMFNLLSKSITQFFIPNLYAKYLYEFFFINRNDVISDVLTKGGLKIEDASKMYDDQFYGFKSPQTLLRWVKLSQNKKPWQSFDYEKLRSRFSLTEKQMEFFIGSYSTISHLIDAVKGSIKSKLSSKTFNYNCPDIYCTESQIVAAQLGANILTSATLLGDISYDVDSIKDVNSTFLNTIQYSTFCKSQEELMCLDQLSVMSFFAENYFSNFTMVQFIYKNKDRMQYLEDSLMIQHGTGKSIVQYMNYLYEKVFNIQNDSSQLLQTLYTKYTYLQKSISRFGSVLYKSLFSNAFFNKFIQKDGKKCEDYYTGNYLKYAKNVCSNNSKFSQFNFKSLQSVLIHIQNFFSVQKRASIQNSLNMTFIQAYQFYQDQSSLIYKQISQIEIDLIAHYSCTMQCSSFQLLARQWGKQQILKNLPKQYFSKSQMSISQLDLNNQLKGFQPQYPKVVKQKNIQFQEAKLLLNPNSQKSIMNLFNMLKMGSEKNSEALTYVQKTVLGVLFGGFIGQRNLDQIFNGYIDQQLIQKSKLNPTQGGTPWMSQKASILQLDNSQRIKFSNQLKMFDEVNSGIYNVDHTRVISAIYGSLTSTSIYTAFADKKYPDNDIIEVISTGKLVDGNNLFGFHPNIQEGQVLKVYIPFAHSSFTLNQKALKSKYGKFDEVYTFDYSFVTNQIAQPIDISVQNLNSYQIKISQDSKIQVDHNTGLTVAFNIKYTTNFQPFYGKSYVNTQKIPLFQTQFIFQKGDLSKIKLLNDYEAQKTLFQILFVAGASLFLTLSIGMLSIYLITKRKISKKNSLLESGQDFSKQNQI